MKRRTFLGILPLPAFLQLRKAEPHQCLPRCAQFDDICGLPCVEKARLKHIKYMLAYGASWDTACRSANQSYPR